MGHPLIITRENRTPQQERMRRLRSFVYPGRPIGKIPGSHIDDMAALKKAIFLCGQCKVKFDHMSHRYYYEKKIRVHGHCDGCRDYAANGHFYIHDSYVVQDGKSRHGNSWLPQ